MSGFKREVTINMLLGGSVARRGGGEGTASTTAAVGNNFPRASRWAAVVFFTRMDVRRAAASMAGSTLDIVVALAATRADVGRRD